MRSSRVRGAVAARPRGGLAAGFAAVAWLLAVALPVLAASPSPTAATGGDPRSSGQGPGLVGDPLLAIGIVVAHRAGRARRDAALRPGDRGPAPDLNGRRSGRTSRRSRFHTVPDNRGAIAPNRSIVLLATPVKKWNSGRSPVMPTKSHTPAPLLPSARPGDATLTVKKAARVLGVHPNTVRAWSEAGRLRFYRINDRGDRRYRLGDLQRFLAAAEAPAGNQDAGDPRRPARDRPGDDHRDDGRPRPPRRPRRGRLPPGRPRPVARRGVPPDPARDRRGARRRSGSAARAGSFRGRATSSRVSSPWTARCRWAAACTRRRSSRRSPSTPGPATSPRRRSSAWARTSSSSASPAARPRGACSCSRAPCSSGPTTAAASRRRSPERWASSSVAPRRPTRRPAGCAAPRPCAGSRRTSPRGSTWPTSCATSPTTPGSCSAPTGSPSSSTTPTAG